MDTQDKNTDFVPQGEFLSYISVSGPLMKSHGVTPELLQQVIERALHTHFHNQQSISINVVRRGTDVATKLEGKTETPAENRQRLSDEKAEEKAEAKAKHAGR
jgi:hypothetical protein